MNCSRLSTVAAVFAASVLLVSCGAPAVQPVATQVPAAPAKAAAPTTAPAASTAAAPTKAPAAQPTAVPPKVDFPQKGRAITILIAFPAGGGADVAARLLAPAMEKELGVPVQVVNKPDAGGQVGTAECAMSKPDGYTICGSAVPSLNTLYLNPERKATFSRKDFLPLALHAVDLGGIAVKADSPFKTVKDVLDAARANPEKVKISANGIMLPGHLGIIQLERTTGVKFATVQFTGDAPANAALVGGHVDASFGWTGQHLPLATSGQVRMVGVADKQRSPFYPDVPTFMEQGINVNITTGRGYTLPAGVPKEILDVLAAASKKAVENAENKRKLEDTGALVRYMDPVQFAAYWDDADAQFGPLIRELAKGQG